MVRENIEALKWLISVSKGNRAYLLASIILAIAAGTISIVPFLLFYKLVQAAFTNTVNDELLLQTALFVCTTIMLKYCLVFASTMCSHRAAFDIQYNVRKHILEHLGSLPLGFFTKKSSGLIRKIISEDIENLEIYIAHHIPDTTQSLTIPIAIFAVLFAENVFLPLALVIPIMLMFAALSKINQKRKKYVTVYFDNAEDLNSATVEYIRVIPIIKIFNIKVESFAKFYSSIQKQIDIAAKWIKESTGYYVLFKSSTELVLPILAIALAALIVSGITVDVTAYILCFILGTLMAKPINQIFTSSNLLCSLMEGAKRVEQILQVEPIREPEIPIRSCNFSSIMFKNVSFAYETNQVLKDISLSIPAPGLFAFIGESGSGKTTCAQLLLRFWEIQQGTIAIGEINIEKLSVASIMQHVAFAFQDAFIVDGTIRENISMGRTDISEAKMVETAKMVAAHDFIARLPKGYDTKLGENGIRLSGGEKQRICLARTILKDSPILVLDEPTSHVDGKTDRLIIESIKGFCRDKIVIFITHRILSAAAADKIFVFNNGGIIGSGQHNELVTSCSEYQRMWDLANKANLSSIGARS